MAFETSAIPDQLIQSILSGKAVAFCGAGLSMGVKRSSGKYLPNWSGLLTEVLETAISEGVKFSGLENEIRDSIKDSKLLIVAQEIEENIPSGTLNKYLRTIFLDRHLVPGKIHKALMNIPFVGYLTTNYDTLLEGAYTIAKEGRLPPLYTQEDLLNVPNPLRVEDDFVFKIHGDINRPDTIVLTSHDYQDLLFRTPHYRSFLETLFTVNTVLFIGFGLVDPDTDLLLDRLAGIYSRNNEHHYALVEKGKYTELEKKRFAIDKRILFIEYENKEGSHNEVFEFVNKLSKITSPKGKLREEYKEKTKGIPEVEKISKYLSVFLSYSSPDKEKAHRIYDFLQKNGIRVWFDQSMIRVGDAIVSKIEEGIANSGYVLALFSKNSPKEWQSREIELAMFNRNREGYPKIIPVCLDSEAHNYMPDSLKLVSWLDLSDDFERNLMGFIKQIKGD